MNFLIEEMAAAATIFFLPPPPPLPPPPNFPNPRPPPPRSDLFNIPNVPRIDLFLNNNDFNLNFSNSYAPAPDPILLRGFSGSFFPSRPSAAQILSNKYCGNKYNTNNE